MRYEAKAVDCAVKTFLARGRFVKSDISAQWGWRSSLRDLRSLNSKGLLKLVSKLTGLMLLQYSGRKRMKSCFPGEGEILRFESEICHDSSNFRDEPQTGQ